MSRRPSGQSGRPNSALGVTSVADAPPRAEQFRPEKIATDFSERRTRRRVGVREYVAFREQGFLVVRGLLAPAEVDELRAHSEDLMYGRVDVPGLGPPAPGMTPEAIASRYLRVHMLHRHLEIEERYLLHPGVLDVLEALIGPDVLALQTMLFFKQPGQPGQGYHQDSYYIPTHPDSLCGAWIAVDRADEENGCLWMTAGSQHEPIYPTEERVGQNHANLTDLTVVQNVSHTDTEVNTLARVAEKHAGREVPVVAEPGDVVFFGGHILHRSHANRSKDRFRRALVGHYANARSFTMWGAKDRRSPANHLHILARGWTHLPFGKPRFGTPVELSPGRAGAGQPMPMAMMAAPEGDMEMAPQDARRNDPTMMRAHEADAVHT